MNDQHERDDDGGMLQAVPGLVRIGISAGWRSAGFAIDTSLRVGSRVLEAASSGESTAELFRSAGSELRDYARRLLGLSSTPPAQPPPGGSPEQNGSQSPLRERGAELLRKSADVTFSEEAHPAYERILDELAPDEGRILRLLATQGSQAAVDVRSGILPVNATSELIAPGLNMIGAEAGCRHMDRVPAYLNNLNRLGLVWFSREPLEDPLAYQVLEAQPEVVDAMKKGRTRTVRRSIQLTPFGEDFCTTVLPLETAEIEALPGGEVRSLQATSRPCSADSSRGVGYSPASPRATARTRSRRPARMASRAVQSGFPSFSYSSSSSHPSKPGSSSRVVELIEVVDGHPQGGADLLGLLWRCAEIDEDLIQAGNPGDSRVQLR